jgi:hypothetical protein
MTTVADAEVLFTQYHDRVFRYMYRGSVAGCHWDVTTGARSLTLKSGRN